MLKYENFAKLNISRNFRKKLYRIDFLGLNYYCFYAPERAEEIVCLLAAPKDIKRQALTCCRFR